MSTQAERFKDASYRIFILTCGLEARYDELRPYWDTIYFWNEQMASHPMSCKDAVLAAAEYGGFPVNMLLTITRLSRGGSLFLNDHSVSAVESRAAALQREKGVTLCPTTSKADSLPESQPGTDSER